jgi:1,4-alpha-glucan branching enzyme
VILREFTKRGDKVKVTFVLAAQEWPHEVFVAGDFNSWNAGSTRLRRRDGHLEATVVLCSGRRYAFRYYSGGRWFNDDAADAHEPNSFGESNSVLDLREALDLREPSAAQRHP